ncbi:hypothetical protein SAMN02927921_02720 [Sinomicrobium oceani]|uniref:Uncharacterized protein n=1 Tax=Sinomicrobium oceani TaxID=1150368 RepID=A0A1K1QP21_9FLAO|nr:hypothetical protein SAMN02927921_02720 [Sinomicrobium oceani]
MIFFEGGTGLTWVPELEVHPYGRRGVRRTTGRIAETGSLRKTEVNMLWVFCIFLSKK